MHAETFRGLLKNERVQALDQQARLLSYATQEPFDEIVVLYCRAFLADSARP